MISPLCAFEKSTRASRSSLAIPWSGAVRNERFSRYWPRVLNGTLRREHLAVFLSIEIPVNASLVTSSAELVEHYGAARREISAQLEEFAATLRTIFGAETPISPMDDFEHFACLRRFLNPSLVPRTEDDPAAVFDPALSIQENCLLRPARPWWLRSV